MIAFDGHEDRRRDKDRDRDGEKKKDKKECHLFSAWIDFVHKDRNSVFCSEPSQLYEVLNVLKPRTGHMCHK